MTIPTIKQIETLESLTPLQLRKIGLTPKDLKNLRILADPVKWCETYLKDPESTKKAFRPRPMQQEIISLRHPKIVVRASRRTGKSMSMAARMLYQAYTEPQTPILLVAPYLSQVKEVFSHMDLLMDGSKVQQCLTKSVQYPNPERAFTNKSFIRGMCAGSTPGRRGSALRGQGAKYIYVDEFDYLDEESLEALLMITKTRVDTELFVTGTPSAFHSWFYKWCTRPEEYGFIARHYGKQHIPGYDPVVDDPMMKKIYSEEGYKREVLAEFTDPATQVFQTKYIDECLFSYDPDELVWDSEKKYGIGVDWNASETGCQIVVLEYLANEKPNDNDKKFLEKINTWRMERNRESQQKLYDKLDWSFFHKKLRVFKIHSVSEEMFTQTEAVDIILRCYMKYKPEFVWVDQGYGEAQVELLLKWALDNKDKKLPKILKACSFSGVIEVKDPMSNAKLKKRFKPYMVTSVQRYLENLDFVLSMLHDDKKQLVSQMREYSIERYSANKDPVFSSGNDHVLDGFMLAAFGFEYNFGPLMKNTKKRNDVPIRILSSQVISPQVEEQPEGSLIEQDKTASKHRVVENREEFFRDAQPPAKRIAIKASKLRSPIKRWMPV